MRRLTAVLLLAGLLVGATAPIVLAERTTAVTLRLGWQPRLPGPGDFSRPRSAVPLEDRLSAGTTGFLRTISKRFRQMRRVLVTALARWQSWLGGAIVFFGLAVVAPVIDRTVLDVWRRDGLRAFWHALSAGIAVYVRLLRDGRSPAVGKALIAFAVVYGVANRDLLPDGAGMVRGFLDDLLLIVLASRGFMRMCEDEIVEEHAMRVAVARGG